MAPRISVIIPVYNAQRYLERCIRSVLAQDEADLEILCVDDGSTDETLPLLRQMAAEDGRIRVLEQDHRSAGAARNLGLCHATGEYLHFLDADDWLSPGIYSHAVDTLERTGAQVCAFQYRVYDDSTALSRPFPCYLDGRERITCLNDEPAFLLYNTVVPWNKLYRRDWVEEHSLRFDEIHCANDRAFYFKLLRTGAKVALTMRHGLYYRVQNLSSLTGTARFANFHCLIQAWESARAAYEQAPAVHRAMLLDTCVQNFLEVFHMAPQQWKPSIFTQLHDCFAALDISGLSALPFPCLWREEFDAIRRAERFEALKVSVPGTLRVLAGKARLWGVRGCLVKALAGHKTQPHETE